MRDTQIDPSDLTLRNSGPIDIELDPNGFRIKPSKFTARQTDLNLEGGYAFNSALRGSAPDRFSGPRSPREFPARPYGVRNSKLDAVLRGSSADPQLSGRMISPTTSLFLRDVSNGIEHANGTIYFERNRANIETLTDKSEQVRLKCRALSLFLRREQLSPASEGGSNIRVRYPEGVSTLLDADLSLVGSSVRSLLSGTVTIARSVFNAKTDLAGMVAQSGSPVPLVVTDSEFLRNMQFDVRVRTDSERDADQRIYAGHSDGCRLAIAREPD